MKIAWNSKIFLSKQKIEGISTQRVMIGYASRESLLKSFYT